LKILVVFICLIWQSIFLIYATKNFLKKRPRKEPIVQYPNVSLRQQLLIIGLMAELLHAGIDPLNAIKSGIEILEEKQKEKYLDVIAGKKIILLLLGGDKRKQNADVLTAKEYWADWQIRRKLK
jgi:hypothetical protein